MIVPLRISLYAFVFLCVATQPMCLVLAQQGEAASAAAETATKEAEAATPDAPKEKAASATKETEPQAAPVASEEPAPPQDATKEAEAATTDAPKENAESVAKETEPQAAPVASEESAPTQDVTTEKAATATAKRPVGLLQLTDSVTASQLGLTQQQREIIAQVLADRVKRLREAGEDQEKRAAAEATNDARLLEVFTEEQRRRWDAYASGEAPLEPRLRFNFSFQPWVDVLEWFADQSGLSLVLDAPPPGTFNYRDTKEYSPTEAIDLLNGVLLTKGYTLVRRDRMLLVLNVADGIPEELIPQITLEDIDDRGQFELVTVTFTLEGRPAAEVQAEIKPLLGERGKASVLAKTNQIVVTDTAGKMRAIRALIESIPKSDTGKDQKPEKQEKPTLDTYSIRGVEPGVTVEALKQLVSEARIVYDSGGEQLVVYATPSQQAVVRSTLEQMQAVGSGENRPELKLHELGSLDPTQTITILKQVAPRSQISIQSDTGRLVVWASPEEHTAIDKSLKELASQGGGDQQLEVYPVHNVDPQSVLGVLTTMLPAADIRVDANTKSIVALATVSEQRTIVETIRQLDLARSQRVSSLKYRIYEYKNADPNVLTTLIKELAPDIQVMPGVGERRLTVIAREDIHPAIAELILEAERDAPAITRPTYRVYEVEKGEAARFVELIRQMVPQANATADAEGRRITVIASSDEHDKVAEVLAEIKQETPAKTRPTYRVYEVEKGEAARFVELIRQMVPQANATADAEGRRITVIALSDEHDKIAEVLAEIKQETPPRVEPVLHLYDLSTEERGKLTLILDAMAIDLPGIRRVPDDKSGALSILASEEQHAEIAAIIAQLRQDLSAETRYSLVAYPIKVAEAASILATLQPLIPDARLTVDPASNSLVAWARPKDHQQIADAIKKIDSDAPVERRLQLMRHEVDKADMSIALQVLQSLYPGVRFVVDSNAKIIYAWANGRDQKAIDETLARMQPDVPEKDRPTLIAYPLRKADPNNIQQVLARAMPTAQVVADTGNSQVIIWATPEEHGEIKKTIAELNQGSTDGMKFVVYPTGSVPVYMVSSLLQSLLPRARVVANPETNHLAVWATEDDHAIVVSTIKEITDAAAADGRKLVTYPIDYASYSPVVNLMANVIPNARVFYDSNSGQLFVWATDTDQATARAAMEKMTLDEASARTMKIYPVNAEASSYATTLLSSVAPLARYVWDTQHGRLLVWGTAREHEQLTDSFAKAATDESSAMNLVIYSIDPDTISSIISVLSTVVPQARVVQDARGSRLMIWATASDHEKVASTVSQLEKTEGGDLQLVVYPVGQEASSYVSTLLYSVAPQARSSWDTQHGRVLVWATPQEHQQLSEAFAKVAIDEESETSLVVYPADSAMTPSLSTLASSIAPQARVIPDSRTGSLMIWATKTDHAKLADAFSKVSSTATDDMRFVVYSVDSALVGSLNSMIYGIAPQAKVVPDYQTGSLLIWASQRDHDTIGKTLESAGTASARARKLTVYAVEAGQSSSLVGLLSGMVPQARVTYDTHGGNLLVWASEQDQAAVVEAMEKMGQSQEAGRNLIVYPLEGADAQSLMSVLYTVVPQARFIPDPQSGNLLAWGTQAEQQHISDAIQKVRQSGGERALKIYPLSGRSSASLSQLMQNVVPQARIVVDNQNGTVLAWASPADHAKIAQSIAEIDAEQAQGGQPEVRVYEVLTSDPYAVLSSLQTMFSGRPDVRFSLDSKTSRIIAWGSEADQERARDVLSKFEEGAPATSQMQLEVYDLGTANPQTVIQAIKPLIKETRGTELIPDAANRQLIALALPAQQATIRTTIEQMQAEEKSLDVLQLTRLDTFTAEDAIRSLFVKEPLPPTVDADYANGRLMVRGTEKQVQEIRQLLFKMGETDLAATQRTGRRNMRVISVEGNVDQTLKEMEKVWPQMRGNPIRVVKPSAMFPTLRSSREKEGNDPSATPDSSNESVPNSPAPEADSVEEPDAPSGTKPGVEAEPKADEQSRTSHARSRALSLDEGATPRLPQSKTVRAAASPLVVGGRSFVAAVALLGMLAQVDAAAPVEESANSAAAADSDNTADAQADASEQPDGNDPREAAVEELSPIIISPGRDGVTIVSDDLDALDEFERLFRSILQNELIAGHEFTMIQIKHADVAIVTETLEKVFSDATPGRGYGQRSYGRRSTGMPPTFVPYQRLNAVLVRANQEQLAAIERLIKVLDTSDLPESLLTAQPARIQLKHAKAFQVAQLLREVYREQLSERRGKRRIPSGFASTLRELRGAGLNQEMTMTAIQQLTAQETGPELTIGIDEQTNSLVLMASKPLLDEIRELTDSLDVASEEASDTVQVVPLKKTSTEAVQRALQMLMRERQSRRGR